MRETNPDRRRASGASSREASLGWADRALARFPRGRSLQWTVRMLVVFSAGCLGWAAWSFADAAMVEAVEGRRLDDAVAMHLDDLHLSHGDPALSEPPAWGELEEGDLVGRIDIDRLDISAIVLSGTTARTLRRSVGHIPGTALPGEGGNVGLSGHRDTFFRALQDVAQGDTISLTTPHGEFAYQVDTLFVVDPSDVHVLDPPESGAEIVTLVTCYPFYFVGPAPERFIVQGRKLEAPGPRTSVR